MATDNHELGRLQEAVAGLSTIAADAQRELVQWRRDDKEWREKMTAAIVSLDKQMAERQIRGDYCEKRFQKLEEARDELQDQREGIAWKVLGAIVAIALGAVQAWIVLKFVKT